MMYGLILLAAIAAPGETQTQSNVSAQTDAEPRAYHIISGEIRDAMRRESLAKNRSDRAEAIYDLSDLYLEVLHDPRLISAPTLQQYKAKIWSRLTRTKKELERELAREQAKKPVAPSENDIIEQETRQLNEDLAAGVYLTTYSLGGPATVMSESGRAFGGGRIDDSAALIDLIQRTIAPEFWDVNGGPGSIAYFPNFFALVVSATAEVHGKLGGTLDALRRAGQ